MLRCPLGWIRPRMDIETCASKCANTKSLRVSFAQRQLRNQVDASCRVMSSRWQVLSNVRYLH
jgi:hypothetical protein